MRCPNCSRSVADGTAICPNCDHILDTSFLGDVPDDLNAEDADDASTQAPAPPSKPAPKPTVAQRPAAKAARPPPPGSRPLPEDDATSAASPAMRGPPPEGESTNIGPPEASDANATNIGPAPARPAKQMSGKRPASRFAQPAEEEEDAPPTARELPAPKAPERSSRPSLKVAPPQQKAGNKYASAAEGRESESTRAQDVGKLPPPAAPPPLDPEAVFRNLWALVLEMPLEDKVELGAAVATLAMLFMPWRTYKGEDDIGLVTWGGFWTLFFVAGSMGLFYLRHTHRIPTFTPKMLTLGELAVAALCLPVDLLFLFTSIDRTKVHGIAGDTWKLMPGFGAVLGLLCAAGLVVGAALSWNRHRNDAN